MNQKAITKDKSARLLIFIIMEALMISSEQMISFLNLGAESKEKADESQSAKQEANKIEDQETLIDLQIAKGQKNHQALELFLSDFIAKEEPVIRSAVSLPDGWCIERGDLSKLEDPASEEIVLFSVEKKQLVEHAHVEEASPSLELDLATEVLEDLKENTEKKEQKEKKNY